MGVLNTRVSTLQMQTEAAGSLGYAGYLQVQQYQQEASRIQEVSTSISQTWDIAKRDWIADFFQLLEMASLNFGAWTLF